MIQSPKTVFLSILLALAAGPWISKAQSQITLQIPTIDIFELRTVVAVPDGGTLRLGGVQRSAYGSPPRSAGLIGGLPLMGRGFKNRAIGSANSSSDATIRVRILDQSELEKQVMQEARRRAVLAQRSDPNGAQTIQKQADFITRNIGRTKNR